jgi:hypothetical protein
MNKLATVAIASTVLFFAAEYVSADPVSRKPLPEGVLEIPGIAQVGGIVGLANGSLMLAQEDSYRISTNGGASWSDPQPLQAPFAAEGMIRLQSGTLAICGRDSANRLNLFAVSDDEGKTWSEPVVICPRYEGNIMCESIIQMSSGRLLIPVYWEKLDGWDLHPDVMYPENTGAFGTWKGHRVSIEGHGHVPEMGMSLVYRSDDEGKSWKKHPGGLMGWFDSEGNVNGASGITPCYEPTIAQTHGDGVLLIARSTVGRLVQSYSPDGGQQWMAVRPTDLGASEAPPLLVSVGPDGDLLLIWNQNSREEIRRGFRRNRLSSAISKDGGHSWEHFKTLELSEGIDDVDRIPPEYPLTPVRARRDVGHLPDNYIQFSYPNIDVVGDLVFVRYYRRWWILDGGELKMPKRYLMRVYPLKWFYQ